MDTAFCRIYHVECRGWVEQKRFSFAMLAVVVLFIAASIILPAMESALVSSTDRLPFGLSEIKAIDTALLLVAAILIVFLICCVIFWAVPKGHMPWRAVWPGGPFVTLAAGIANWLFPVYLSNVSSPSRFGSTLGFVLIALLWFYVLSLALMAGAVMNSLRHELTKPASCRTHGRAPRRRRIVTAAAGTRARRGPTDRSWQRRRRGCRESPPRSPARAPRPRRTRAGPESCL